jgi:hypothetical protein
MSHTAKNILIVFLLIVIAFLFYLLFATSYGRYCSPIIKDLKPPQKSENPQPGNKDSLKIAQAKNIRIFLEEN